MLHWLHSGKQLQQFVRNRVQEIKRYYPTADNPADLLTIKRSHCHTASVICRLVTRTAMANCRMRLAQVEIGYYPYDSVPGSSDVSSLDQAESVPAEAA